MLVIIILNIHNILLRNERVPAAKCKGVERLPVVSLVFTLIEFAISVTFNMSPFLQASKNSLLGSFSEILVSHIFSDLLRRNEGVGTLLLESIVNKYSTC